MSNNFIAKNDYKLINFTKSDAIIIKRIKDYAKRNCREQINTSYITSTLQNFDYGISYFRTEILTKDNSEKNRPCAFVCIKNIDNKIMFIMLICSIKNNDNLGTKILENLFIYAKNNGYTTINLECNKSLVKFYKKHNFIELNKLDDDMIVMTKIIE